MTAQRTGLVVQHGASRNLVLPDGGGGEVICKVW